MKYSAFLLCLTLLSCQSNAPNESTDTDQMQTEESVRTLGSIEFLDDQLKALIHQDAKLEILAEGHDWTEGPVWVPGENMLLYSDIPPNSIFKWTEAKGSELYLKPSGYTGIIEREGEPGSNGLLLNATGELILCQHGDRRIARLVGSLSNPNATYETIIDRFEGKRFNSPNDATYAKDQTLFFTDPPYGLEGNVNDPMKEIPFQGVYKLKSDGELSLITREMSRPNGIALAPDESVLYVANSDPERAIWMAFDLDENKMASNGRVFYDATSSVGAEKGLPDGLKVHPSGTIFATGPGGVWVFNPNGKVIGKIKTGEATANCAFNTDFTTLFITADMYLLRVNLKT